MIRFEKAHPLEGPPSEWLSAGISRRSGLKGMKGLMAAWDKEWVELAKENTESTT